MHRFLLLPIAGALILAAGVSGANAQQPAAVPARPPAAADEPARPAVVRARAGSVILDQLIRPAPDVRVNLDLNNVPVPEALKQVFAQAKLEYELDADVPADKRVTARAEAVQLGTALDLVTQAGGVGWTRTVRDGKTVYRVGKNRSPVLGLFPNVNSVRAVPGSTYSLDLNKIQGADPFVYRWNSTERRSTFTCPHCKRRSTVIRTALPQPKCTKCQQTFQANWEFCPNDGTKRPQDQSAWKFCPFCSKPVAAESQRDIAAAPVTLTMPELAVVATPPAAAVRGGGKADPGAAAP